MVEIIQDVNTVFNVTAVQVVSMADVQILMVQDLEITVSLVAQAENVMMDCFVVVELARRVDQDPFAKL